MKLALVYPPFHNKAFNENLATVDDEFGLFPHLSFGWVSAVAKNCGWEVRLFDGAATRLSVEEAIAQLRRWQPDLIGFAAHACQTIQDLYRWARRIRRETGIASLVGGYEAKVYPAEIMEQGCFDFLCGGEAPSFLPEFLPTFERGHGYAGVADLYYRDRETVRCTFPAARTVPFAEFPIPDRTIFPLDRYYSHVSQRRYFTIGMSEVGCPYPCSFCCMRVSGFEARSPPQILDEIEDCVRLGIREIDWFDPLMLHDRERVMTIARELRRRKLDLIWSCRSRLDSLSFHRPAGEPDEELITTLAEGGCRRIYFGIESGDDEVLRGMKKAQRANRHVRKVLACVADRNIMALGFFMLGAPGDTRESCQTTVRFSTSLPLSYAQYQIAIVKPHTELEKVYLIDGLGFDYWREYVRGTVGEYLLPSPWTALTRSELEHLAKRAYFQFYRRPKYILAMLGRIESWAELRRYVRVGLQLLIRPLRPSRSRLVRRLVRAVGTFCEALVALVSGGARHSVFAWGGGLAGAWRMARAEFRRRDGDALLTPELVATWHLKRRARPTVPLAGSEEPPAPFPVVRAGRYVAWFEQRRRTAGDPPRTGTEPPRRDERGDPGAGPRRLGRTPSGLTPGDAEDAALEAWAAVESSCGCERDREHGSGAADA